jgi:hypothetical protein
MLQGPSIDSGFSHLEALTNFIASGLGGTVRASDYPAGGNDRIFRDAQLVALVPEPATLMLLALGVAGVGWSRGKRAAGSNRG